MGSCFSVEDDEHPQSRSKLSSNRTDTRIASECMTDVDEETSGDTQSRRRLLYGVLEQVRQDKKHIYEPVMVSLGPSHHGRLSKSKLVEQLKNELQGEVCGGPKHEKFLLEEIGTERIGDIKDFYGGLRGHSHQKLAEMMLRDACFFIGYMQGNQYHNLISQRLGMSGMLFVFRDMIMLENQIPLWLISLIYPNQSFLCEFLSYCVFGDNRMTELPWGDGRGEEPLHLLEALHRTFLTFLSLKETQENSSCFLRLINKFNQPRAEKKSSRTMWEMMNTPFWSATDLKAKGIHFRRSSNCLTDIKFFSFALYAQLHLPSIIITNSSKVFFPNLIAFLMSSETDTDLGVMSYFHFMKALIHNAKGVKLLREKGILYSRLASDEEVVETFKSIDTYGFANKDPFLDVTMRIEEHCNSKAGT